MLLNRRGEVFVGARADMPSEAWQMPQGGIDEGEDPAAAAFRELKEEVGTDNAEILAESRDWLCYDLPPAIRERARHGNWRGQRQKWFVMRFRGDDSEIAPATRHPEFRAWKWVPIDALPDLIVSFKREVYLALVAEFAGLARLVALLGEPVVRLMMAADGVSESEIYDLFRRVAQSLRRRRKEGPSA
jgi:putative (di)nucleoside polyphosphate hydrolase